MNLTPVLLFGLFAGLQLGHAVDWSWWAITAPLWVYALEIEVDR